MKYKSARELARAMSEGEIPIQHLGPKNYYILKQELFSLKNEYKPDTMTEDELKEWNTRLASIMETCHKTLSSQQIRDMEKEIDKALDVGN